MLEPMQTRAAHRLRMVANPVLNYNGDHRSTTWHCVIHKESTRTQGKATGHVVARRLATCPTCRCRGEFEYLGEQHWPVELTRLLGYPESIALWSCPACQTTISEPDLLPARMGNNCTSDMRVKPSTEYLEE